MNRHTKIHERQCKRSYKGLDKDQKRLIKLTEDRHWLEVSVNQTYRDGYAKYGEGYGKDKRFFDDWERILAWNDKIAKINHKIERLESKLNMIESEVRHLHNQNNNISVSF